MELFSTEMASDTEKLETVAAAPASPKTSYYLIGGMFLLRLLFLGFPDLFPEEAYFWNYARHLDLGYLDHPPMVAWLIYAGTAFFGENEFGVRIGALLCSGLAAFWIFRLTRLLYDERAAIMAVVLLQLLPFFFSTGFMITPDASLPAVPPSTFSPTTMSAGDCSLRASLRWSP